MPLPRQEYPRSRLQSDCSGISPWSFCLQPSGTSLWGEGHSLQNRLIFMVLLAATSGINWYVRLTLVPKIAAAGDTNALALLDIHEINSLMYAVEHLAWGLFYGLAAIFMAFAMEGGKIETWIRWLLIAGGIMSILFIPGIMISSEILIDLGYYAAGILLPIMTALLAVRYRKT